MAYLGYMLSHRRHPMPVKKDERPCSSAKERLEILAYSFGRLVADCDSTATRVKSRARHRTYRSVPLLSPSNASLLKQARIKRAEWVGSMAVAHSGPAPSLRHADFGSNSDSSIGTVVDSSHDVEAAPSKKSEQDINSSDEKSAGRDAMREKPVMPRAKRVISFDDQTSRLSRSKLVIV